MSSRTTELRLLTLSAFAAALLPRLVHRGLFLDGLTDAAIARNLAEGRGRFWQPFYTATIHPAFYEHPPLAFWLQSLWFRALGDHWFVERLYCAAAALAIAALTVWTWRVVYSPLVLRPAQDERLERDYDWLPVALWIVVPVVSWTIVGNMLETTVAVFASAAVALVVAGTATSRRMAVATGALSGLCVAGAVLSKGPVGLFPLAAPVIVGLLPERRRRIIWSTVAQWGTLVACGLLLFSAATPRASLLRYLNQQVVAALAGRREVSGSSFTIVIALLEGVWLPMAAVALALIVAARAWRAPAPRDRHVAIAFTVLGLAGTLPILASPKQSGHYLMPAVPFYAIGAAAMLLPTAQALADRLTGRRARWIVGALAAAIVAVAAAAAQSPALERDPARIADLDRLASVVPRGETIGLCPAANGDWALHAWFQRRFEVSLDASAARHAWFLKTGPDAPGCPPPACAPASDAAASLTLMRCAAQ